VYTKIVKLNQKASECNTRFDVFVILKMYIIIYQNHENLQFFFINFSIHNILNFINFDLIFRTRFSISFLIATVNLKNTIIYA